jgi:hypothetical protein
MIRFFRTSIAFAVTGTLIAWLQTNASVYGPYLHYYQERETFLSYDATCGMSYDDSYRSVDDLGTMSESIHTKENTCFDQRYGLTDYWTEN